MEEGDILFKSDRRVIRKRQKLNPFQRFILKQQFRLSENWSKSKIESLGSFLGLKTKKVAKWRYHQKLEYYKLRDNLQESLYEFKSDSRALAGLVENSS